MVEYRLFSIDNVGRVAAASTVILCDTDEQAIVEAKSLSLGPKVEVWQGDRVVAVLTAAV